MTKSKYEIKDHRQHIYDLPDTYIGSSASTENELYIFKNDKIEKKTIEYIPGFNKLFDEILVNAIDAYTRTNLEKEKNMRSRISVVSEIKINYDINTGFITIYNDGEGIEISKIKNGKTEVYIPEMIFGILLTSENFDTTDARITGGKNGYGAKLTNIFSKQFKIVTVNKKKKLKYTQIWKNNMLDKSEPEIIKYTGAPYTEVSFLPDYNRFGLSELNDNILSIFNKRVYDTSLWFSNNGMTMDTGIMKKKSKNGNINIYLNDKLLQCNILNYVNLYAPIIEHKDIYIESG